jgi:hypothetical protein
MRDGQGHQGLALLLTGCKRVTHASLTHQSMFREANQMKICHVGDGRARAWLTENDLICLSSLSKMSQIQVPSFSRFKILIAIWSKYDQNSSPIALSIIACRFSVWLFGCF